jgi:hypothetical protein
VLFAIKTHILFFREIVNESTPRETRCALLFFGLPRGYKTIVLPSIVRNVLEPNANYNCDVYAHSISLDKEQASRSGKGGMIDSKSIYLLKQRVQEVASSSFSSKSTRPHVVITMDTEEDFWILRNATLQKYRTTKTRDGKLLYFPWKSISYKFPTSIDNMVKQWHSIERVWNLMEEESQKLHVRYDRVAMMRSDVFYATPIDIMRVDKTTHFFPTKQHEKEVVLPGFAMYPVNDRMIYGCYEGVQMWATLRFQKIDAHVLKVEQRGFGMHSERFLNGTILPAIRASGIKVNTNYDVCFFRVRADDTIWYSDCQRTGKNAPQGIIRDIVKVNKKKLVEDMLGLPCTQSNGPYHGVMQLDCRDPNTTTTSRLIT